MGDGGGQKILCEPHFELFADEGNRVIQDQPVRYGRCKMLLSLGLEGAQGREHIQYIGDERMKKGFPELAHAKSQRERKKS